MLSPRIFLASFACRAVLLAVAVSAAASGCSSPPPPPPPPDPQAERDRECIQRFIAPRLPTPQDVAFLYPMQLNPRDAQGRPIFVGHRQAANGAQQGFCYVEPSLVPSPVPLPAAPVSPPGVPGMAPPQEEVPCPPAMQDARWWACPDGRVVTNAARCPCACFASGRFAPPSVLPMPCPPGA